MIYFCYWPYDVKRFKLKDYVNKQIRSKQKNVANRFTSMEVWRNEKRNRSRRPWRCAAYRGLRALSWFLSRASLISAHKADSAPIYKLLG